MFLFYQLWFDVNKSRLILLLLIQFNSIETYWYSYHNVIMQLDLCYTFAVDDLWHVS